MIRTTLLALLLVTNADAAQFSFSAANSQLRFTGDYGGEAVPGLFKQFSGTVQFDLAQPLATRFETTIDVASLDTDYAERDETLRGPEFFDTTSHPSALWQSNAACSANGARLTCPGSLTLKGKTHPVEIDIAPSADGRSIEGKASLSRALFDVGSGDWADAETIAHQVAIEFTLQLVPGGK